MPILLCLQVDKEVRKYITATGDAFLLKVWETMTTSDSSDDGKRWLRHMWRAVSRAAAPQDALLDSVVQRSVSPILRNLGRRLLVFRVWHHAMDNHLWACPQYYNGIRNAYSGPDHVNADMYLMPVPDYSDEE